MYNCFIIKTLFHPSKNQLKTVLNFAECSLYSLVTQWPQYVRFRLLQSNALWLCHKIYKISKMQLYNSNYKFTFKIDTISINLLFECVKIVEFNFNSHVFLVMYQEIRFVNQDVFLFLIKKRDDSFWSVLFPRGTENENTSWNSRWLLIEVNQFFEGLISLLQQCGDCVNENTDGGHAEFLARRLDEYQRTLRVMYGRVTESAQDYCRIHSGVTERMLLTILSRCQTRRKI